MAQNRSTVKQLSLNDVTVMNYFTVVTVPHEEHFTFCRAENKNVTFEDRLDRKRKETERKVAIPRVERLFYVGIAIHS